MGAKTNLSSRSVLDWLLLGSGPVYCALTLSVPDNSGIFTEVSAPDYVRPQVTFAPATTSPGNVTTASLAEAVEFADATITAWGTVVGFAIMNQPTGGQMLYKGVLDSSHDIGPGEPVQFGVGQLVLAEA